MELGQGKTRIMPKKEVKLLESRSLLDGKYNIPSTLKEALAQKEDLQTSIRGFKMALNYKIMESLLKNVEPSQQCSICSVGEFSKTLGICCSQCPVTHTMSEEERQTILSDIDGST